MHQVVFYLGWLFAKIRGVKLIKQFMEKTRQLATQLIEFTDAKSVFLYGSRARTDFYNASDYEIGVLMEKNKYVSREKIKKHFNEKRVNIFPFYYEDFIAYNPDTPFQKSIYMKEIIDVGKTLAGEKIIENMTPPEIKILDLIQDIRFNLGYALAATHSYRNGDSVTATLHFTKSCLFGTRNYIVFKTGKFLTSYDDILDISSRLDLREYKELPMYALQLRKQCSNIDDKKLFQNISYLNRLIEKELIVGFKNKGNDVLVR